MSDSTNITLITDEFDVTVVSRTNDIDISGGEVDLTAKFQVNVGTQGVVLDFSVFGGTDEPQEVRERIAKESEALRAFVAEVLAFQGRFDTAAYEVFNEIGHA